MADLLQKDETGGMNMNKIESKDVQYLVDEAIAYASAHGFMIGSTNGAYVHAPFSLLPIQFPKEEFDKGVLLSPLYARLVDKVSRNVSWIASTLENVVVKDEFTRKLLDLFQLVEAEGLAQTAYLGIHRSDYMLHQPSNEPPRLQQVELNTIASSFGCLSSLVCHLHKYIVGRYPLPQSLGASSTHDLPENNALEEISHALARAHQYYVSKNYGTTEAAIVFVVQPGEVNSVDQRLLEHQLWEKHSIRVFRKTLKDMKEQTELDSDKVLYLKQHNVAVSVVYFRAGYTPNDYPSEKEWEGRTTIERSRAIKCPSIAYHLVGTKKVQQTLARDGQLEKFISNADDCRLLRQSFAGLYGLERNDREVKGVIENVLADPNAFVMKPQREGGGNNLYGEEMRQALKDLSPDELETYIIMSRIVPKPVQAILVRNGQAIRGSCVNELGMYGTCLFDNNKEIFNTHAGHLLRTKLSETQEGGVATGYAVLSSPDLQN